MERTGGEGGRARWKERLLGRQPQHCLPSARSAAHHPQASPTRWPVDALPTRGLARRRRGAGGPYRTRWIVRGRRGPGPVGPDDPGLARRLRGRHPGCPCRADSRGHPAPAARFAERPAPAVTAARSAPRPTLGGDSGAATATATLRLMDCPLFGTAIQRTVRLMHSVILHEHYVSALAEASLDLCNALKGICPGADRDGRHKTRPSLTDEGSNESVFCFNDS